MAITVQELGWNHALDNIHYMNCEEGQTMLVPKYSVEVYYRLHYPNNKRIAAHIGFHIIC